MNIEHYTPNTKPQPGTLYINMPDSIYHTSPGISKSGLDRITLSPAHYRYREPSEPSRFMAIGSAIHAALLQPDVFAAKYLQLRDVKVRTASEYKAAVKDWLHGADFVLTGPESDHIAGMQAAVDSSQHARELLGGNDGYFEASLFVKDPITGVLVRVRFDRLREDGRIIDLKKTRDCRAEKFTRHIAEYRYHVQAALYSDALEWATGEPARAFVMLAIEDKLPHALKPYILDADAMREGRKQYRADLNRYAECLARDEWPCYDTAPEFIGLPVWAMEDEEIMTDDEVTIHG